MTLTPRMMIVGWVSTNVQEGGQNLGLTLLNREASAKFYEQFPPQSSADVAKILDYARKNSIDWIGKPESSFRHKTNYQTILTNYHLGDVVTEQAAFNFGYYEPRMDTIVGQMVQKTLKTTNDLASLKTRESYIAQILTEKFREESFIGSDYSVMLTPGRVHVFANDVMQKLEHSHHSIFDRHSIGRSHPIDLVLWTADENNSMPVGASFYVPQNNGVYEFMTYVPLPALQNKKKH
jgi:hypothetical protein